MVNFVPFLFSLSKVIVASDVSLSFLATGKPNPLPLALVVNSGLKILFFASSGFLLQCLLRCSATLWQNKEP